MFILELYEEQLIKINKTKNIFEKKKKNNFLNKIKEMKISCQQEKIKEMKEHEEILKKLNENNLNMNKI